MLRLRFLSAFPSATDASGSISFEVTATNESGSTQALATPLELAFRLCAAADGAPLREADSGLLLRGGGSIGTSGVGAIALLVRSVAGARGAGAGVRVEVAPARGAAARVVPAASGAPRGGAGGKKWVPTAEISVATVCTPVFWAGGGGGDGGGNSGGEAAAAAIHVLPNGLRILEHHTRVVTGFGSIVWDSALLAARSLAPALAPPPPPARPRAAAPPPPLRGLRAVDLACGTGYLGIAAAALGADVTLTDGLPEVLQIARANAALNRAAVARSGGALAVAGCAWGEPVAHLLPAGGAPFDVVLASEAVYSQEQFAPFAATLRALSGPRTRVVLAVRQRACCSLEDLLALLREHFDATELPLEAAALIQAEALSKTLFKPQLFLLVARALS